MTKRIAWATDLHLNTVEDAEFERFCRDVRTGGARCLLLGGDVAEAEDVVMWLERLDAGLQMPIYFVLGNHDYYGSDVATVRSAARTLPSADLRWLPDAGCVRLTSDVGLVGHGGWGDARIGDVDRFVLLTDYLAIADLAETLDRDDLLSGFTKREPLRRQLELLGDEAAESLRPALLEAIRDCGRVLVLTHVPPFREACWHGGQVSEGEWLPGFTCKAVGDLLLEAAASKPDCQITVLCGHTHGTGYAELAPNLDAFTAEAAYGAVSFRMMDLKGTMMEMRKP